MAQNSNIEWTDHTANFWWGCFKVSDGCKNCYAETLSNRYGKSIWGPPKTTDRELKKGIWKELPKWNRQAKEQGVRKRVFVQSMADFFEDHPQVTEWRCNALSLMQDCKHLDFQVLTKRPENVNRMIEQSRSHGFSDADMWFTANPHVWIGTSVENQETADERIPHLLQIPAAVRFLSCEPLLGPVDLECIPYYNDIPGTYHALAGSWWPAIGDPDEEYQNRLEDLLGIDWVIVGGESGPNARPMHPDWVRSIRDQCQAAGVPFLFKQWGAWLPGRGHTLDFEYNENRRNTDWNARVLHDGPFLKDELPTRAETARIGEQEFWKVGKKAAGRLLGGREWNEFPAEEVIDIV